MCDKEKLNILQVFGGLSGELCLKGNFVMAALVAVRTVGGIFYIVGHLVFADIGSTVQLSVTGKDRILWPDRIVLIRILHCHAVQLDITDLTQILSGINVKTYINRLIIMLNIGSVLDLPRNLLCDFVICSRHIRDQGRVGSSCAPCFQGSIRTVDKDNLIRRATVKHSHPSGTEHLRTIRIDKGFALHNRGHDRIQEGNIRLALG